MKRTLLAFLWMIAALGSVPAAGEADPVSAVLAAADTSVEPGTLGDLFNRSAGLAALGKGAEPAVRKLLSAERGFDRLAGACALLERAGDDPAAVASLEKAARGNARAEASLAVAVLERFRAAGTVQALSGLARDGSLDAAVRIEAAASWWRVTGHPGARQVMVDLANAPDAGPSVRRAAVLGAAEADGISLVRKDLDRIALESTLEGRLARALLARDAAADLAAAKDNPAFLGREKVLEEIIAQVQEHYVDDRRVAVEALFDAAGRGIAEALDKHCEYLTPEEAKLREEMFRGEYAGVGAQVAKDEAGFILIESAFYGGPAHKAGLRTGDRIVKVEGESVQEFSLTEGVKRLRGPIGSPVTIEVARAGFQEPQKFTLTRGTIHRDSVFWEMLPAGVGYLRLVQFGEKSYEEFARALDAMERAGMKGLVIDLRGNGGGLLDAAVAITAQFLPAGSVVTYTEGRSPEYGRREEYQAGGSYWTYHAREGGQVVQVREWLNPDEARKRGARPPAHRMRPDYPIAILIDKGSASASEILSGAMQAHGRAVLVGTTSYGKGSVQREIPLASSRRVKDGVAEQARIKFTIAKYFLKDGVSIHGTGVKPDIESEIPPMEGWKFAAWLKLVNAKAFQKFFDAWYMKDKARYETLLFSGAPEGEFPGYADWARENAPPGLSPADLFGLFRMELRKRIADEAGKPFPLELPLAEDVPLQRAIVELAGKTGLDLGGVKEYAPFKDTFSGRKNPASSAK